MHYSTVNVGVKESYVLSAHLFILYPYKCIQKMRTMNVEMRMIDLVALRG